MDKNDIANKFEAPFWTDQFGGRPLALIEFIEKHNLILPRRFKGGFVE